MNKKDVSFKIEEGNIKFNFRVAGLMTTKDKILLQSTTNDDFLALLGGRVQLLEDTKTALIRECKEELGVEFKEKDFRLLDVIENFFKFEGSNYHEILYVYKIKIPKEFLDKEEIKTLDKDDSVNKWYSLKDLDKLNIKPDIIKEIYSTKRTRHDIVKSD